MIILYCVKLFNRLLFDVSMYGNIEQILSKLGVDDDDTEMGTDEGSS